MNIKFVIRSKEKHKHEEIKSLIKENQELDIGDNLLIKDSIINLYTEIQIKNKLGKEKVENPFRFVVVKNKDQATKLVSITSLSSKVCIKLLRSTLKLFLDSAEIRYNSSFKKFIISFLPNSSMNCISDDWQLSISINCQSCFGNCFWFLD
jgi:hypothetical protein